MYILVEFKKSKGQESREERVEAAKIDRELSQLENTKKKKRKSLVNCLW